MLETASKTGKMNIYIKLDFQMHSYKKLDAINFK